MTRIGLSNLGQRLADACARHDVGNVAAAEIMLHQVPAHDPAHLAALVKLADIAIERRDHASAMRHATEALRLEPRCAPALSQLSQALWLAGRIAEGAEPGRLAVEIQPTNPRYRLALGQLLAVMGHGADAEAIITPLIDQTWQEPPMRARALGVLATIRSTRGAFAAAHQALVQAVSLAPNDRPTRVAYGMSVLRSGALTDGWLDYSQRDHPDVSLQGERWSGQPLTDRTILLRDEQGHGDAIQFFRYVPSLRRAGAKRIVLATFSNLVRLFQASTTLAEVVDTVDQTFIPDFHCVTGDLPGAFQTTLDTIPASVPYIRPPAGEDLGMGGIGLAWSGDPRHLKDAQRSIPADTFLPIADGSDHRFVSLQSVVRPRDAPALARRPAIDRTVERFPDFARTAAMVARLDLVITVDTAIAHVAGALGKPVWVLLPPDCDWRWLLDRDDSPWYPTMRLFRAGQDGWAPVIERVKHALSTGTA